MTPQHKTIKDMPEHSRPREKLREKGASALTDLVEANRKLVEMFERKIQAKLAEIWGEETRTT